MSEFKILKKSILFRGIEEKDYSSLFQCLRPVTRYFDKDEYIIKASQAVLSLGIVLEGSVNVIQEDYWGNRIILTKIEEGGLFAESFFCLLNNRSPVSVVAAQKSTILFISFDSILSSCDKVCGFHQKLIQNMMMILAQKNQMLTGKVEHMGKKTIREKVLSYLSMQSQMLNSNQFEIPYNRQELADYLSVDRSALSNELGKLRDENVLRFNKNWFNLL